MAQLSTWNPNDPHSAAPCGFDCRTFNCSYAIVKNRMTGRWFIRMGHAGYNTRLNNGHGYATARTARASHRRYNSRTGWDAK